MENDLTWTEQGLCRVFYILFYYIWLYYFIILYYLTYYLNYVTLILLLSCEISLPTVYIEENRAGNIKWLSRLHIRKEVQPRFNQASLTPNHETAPHWHILLLPLPNAEQVSRALFLALEFPTYLTLLFSFFFPMTWSWVPFQLYFSVMPRLLPNEQVPEGAKVGLIIGEAGRW